MTEGHTHRHVKVKRNGIVHRVLTTRLFHTTNLRRADASPYPYGECYSHGYSATGRNDCCYLSTLSILHRWTGLTLEVEE